MIGTGQDTEQERGAKARHAYRTARGAPAACRGHATKVHLSLMPTIDTRIYGNHSTYMHGDRTIRGSFSSCCHVRRQLSEALHDGSSPTVPHEELEARLLRQNRPERSDLQQDWCARAHIHYCSPSGSPAMSLCMSEAEGTDWS